MKTILFSQSIALFFFLLLNCHALHSQDYSAGLKLGAGYSINDNGSEVFANGSRFSAESDLGYLGGAFLEWKFGKWLLRPEAFLNRASGTFVFPSSSSQYTLDKLSIPLLVGYRVYGPFDIYAGPAYQLILDKTLDNTTAPIDQQHNNLAAQVGIKMVFNRWEIDLRYDFTLKSNEFQNIGIRNYFSSGFFDDGRLNQALLSINYKLFGSNIERGRRGGNCYF